MRSNVVGSVECCSFLNLDGFNMLWCSFWVLCFEKCCCRVMCYCFVGFLKSCVFVEWFHTRPSVGRRHLPGWRCMRVFHLHMTKLRGWLFLMLLSKYWFWFRRWIRIFSEFEYWMNESLNLGCWGFKRGTNTAPLDNYPQRLDGTTPAPSRCVILVMIEVFFLYLINNCGSRVFNFSLVNRSWRQRGRKGLLLLMRKRSKSTNWGLKQRRS